MHFIAPVASLGKHQSLVLARDDARIRRGEVAAMMAGARTTCNRAADRDETVRATVFREK
jgi:hypothetical protein